MQLPMSVVQQPCCYSVVCSNLCSEPVKDEDQSPRQDVCTSKSLESERSVAWRGAGKGRLQASAGLEVKTISEKRHRVPERCGAVDRRVQLLQNRMDARAKLAV